MAHERNALLQAAADNIGDRATLPIPWLSIIELLLSLPCWHNLTPAEKRLWVQDHPNLARNRIMAELRRKDRTTSVKDRRKAADAILEEIEQTNDADLLTMFGGGT